MFPTEWKPKLWGRTRTLYRDDQIEIVECEIREGGYSSEHVHHWKHNQFMVAHGCIDLIITEPDIGPGRIRLNQGGTWTVPAGIAHMFHASLPTRLIETYVTTQHELPVSPDDIERFSTGGIRPCSS